MILSYSDNAIMAKVHVLYGKRLTGEHYDQLLQKKTVAEVATYLKKETYYAESLGEVKEDLIHHAQLENVVRRRPLDICMKLLKYTNRETMFLRLYIMQNEIEQLLTAIRLFNAGSIDRYIIGLPVHLAKLISFDLFAIPSVKSYEDLLAVVEHSEYYQILARFRPTTMHRLIDITACEKELLTHYYQQMLDMANRDYFGDARKDLLQLLQMQLQLHNLSVIFRMRRYLGADAASVRPRLVLVEGANNRLYDQLLAAPDLPTMLELMKTQSMLRQYQVDWSQSAKHSVTDLLRVRKRINRKLFRFSVRPVVTAISYMALLEIEVRNIVCIIEGVRYGMPPAELRELLCL